MEHSRQLQPLQRTPKTCYAFSFDIEVHSRAEHYERSDRSSDHRDLVIRHTFLEDHMENIYERKISSEEAAQRYFLVLKNKLQFFPSVGTRFSVKVGAKEKKALVESYHCECRGPEEPHEHFFVRWPGLAKGDKIVVQKNANGNNRYSITIEE